jgi:GH25 family lysozyme M1 (1,4-beta-N-acetylmuramidase)
LSSPTRLPVTFRAGVVADTAPAPQTAAASPGVLLSDISAWQPDIADAAYLAWSRAVVIRAMYGTAVDGAWYGGGRRNALHAGGARFVGIYAYLTAGQDAGVQARALVNLVANLRQGEKLVCDIEEGPPDEQAARFRQWSAVITGAYGPAAEPWLYAGLDFAAAAGLDPQWLAASRNAEPPGNHILWQFSESYPVPGVGIADCSLFRGTIGELAALGWQGTPVTPPPPTPGGWTYDAPRNLHAAGGHTSVALAWQPPIAPVPPDHYLIWLYRGTVADAGTLVPSYPRSTDSSPWQGGGLDRGQQYTAHVAAAGLGGTRMKPYTYATATFSTG